MAKPERIPVEHFERLYANSSDPWDYEGSSFELAKRHRTLAMLPQRTGRALELGCSVGVFSEMLAPRCETLLAVDFSPTAVERAQARLVDCSNVKVEQRVLPEEIPAGKFDAIICSEVFIYWSDNLIRLALVRLEEALAPGGILVAVDWRGPKPQLKRQRGDEIHDLLNRETALELLAEEKAFKYRLSKWISP